MMDFPFPGNEWRKSIQYVITLHRHLYMVVKEFNIRPTMFVGSANVRGNICLFTMEGEPPHIVHQESHGNVSWCKRARHARTHAGTHVHWCRTNNTHVCINNPRQPAIHPVSHTHTHMHTYKCIQTYTLAQKTQQNMPAHYLHTNTYKHSKTHPSTNKPTNLLLSLWAV